MVDRGISTHSKRLKVDRISQLPDPLICQILSLLPTKDSVRTSVLSTRWKSLWLWVPSLDLVYWRFSDFNGFKSFGDRFFDSNRVSCIQNVRLNLANNDDNDASYHTSWIDALVKRKIQRLSLPMAFRRKMPLSLYACETLVHLDLSGAILVHTEFVSLPCLKTMHLRSIKFTNEATFERLVSSCPVLEELEIYLNVGQYRVHSLSLKRLKLKLNSSIYFQSFLGVVIDAPLLCCFTIIDTESQSLIVNRIGSNAKLDIDNHFGLKNYDQESVTSKRSCIRSFLLAISKVMDMTISRDTIKIINQYSKLESLPEFDTMSRLHATLHVSDLKGFLNFLERCPNLKSLILVLHEYVQEGSEKMNQISYLPGISRVMDLKLSSEPFKLIYQYSKLQPLPQFGYMSRLDVKLCVTTLEWLPTFLESCPNLKSLILEIGYDCKQMNQISSPSVPVCLLSSLEFVEISLNFPEYAAEMKLVKYFLENSAILKKLTLRMRYYLDDDISKEVNKIPRRSSTCQVFVVL